MAFDACRESGFLERLPVRPNLVVCGCVTHVCVLRTVLGLLHAGRRVFLTRDAVGSRRAESKATAIRRMDKNGAEIVTTETVLFEWLATAADRVSKMCSRSSNSGHCLGLCHLAVFDDGPAEPQPGPGRQASKRVGS